MRLGEPEDLAGFLDATNADFVVATGDLTNQGIAEEYAALAGAVAGSRTRIHLVPGNHDHMNGLHDFVTTSEGALENAADTAGYEENIGPRWYSFDYGRVHFISIDWHTWTLGLDREAQTAWLVADLAHVPPDMPWILLFHDQPDQSLMDLLPRPPVATFSGHRHTDRTFVRDGVRHVNTPTVFFAGLDSSPPTHRIAQWDGTRITTETVTRGQAHVHQPVYCARQRCVVVGSDRGIEAIDADALERRWTVSLDAPVRGRPVIVGSTVVAVTVTGDMVALNATEGSLLWSLDSSDPLRRWAFNDLCTDGTVVIAGDSTELVCVDATSGELRWRVADIAARTNIVARAACVIVDDLVVGGFWPGSPPRFALGIEDGTTVWVLPPSGGSFADEFTGPSPHATPTFDPVTGLVVTTSTARVDATDPRSGETTWSTGLPTFFNLASPIATDAGIALTLPGRGVVMLDRTSGAERWRVDIYGPAPFSMIPYERAPSSPVFAAPCVAGDALVLPGLDGSLRILELDDGSFRKEIPVGVPMAAPPLEVDGRVFVRGTDSSLHVRSIA